VPSALDLVERADRALREEIDGLVAQVVAAVPKPEEGARSFGGVSSLMLWGAVTLNVRVHNSVIALAEGLVHETAHHLLFGLSRTEPLVENAIDESFASPLRKEPRPMDGVYHATFVCARIHYFYERLLKLDMLTGGERDRADRGVAVNRERFLAGLETVRAEARLTPNGQHVLAGAEAHIAGAA
jgi:HEXXH motif-containing protein